MANITAKKQKINNTKSKNTKTVKPVPKQHTKKVAPKPDSEEEEESESEYESEPEDNDSDSEEEEESESDSEIEDDDDDELDVAGVSSDEGSASESDSDSDDMNEEIPKLKKKKNTDDGSSSFSTAVNAILGSKLKKYDRTDPILVRSKKTIKKFEDDKLEQKARRLINTERKLKLNANRVRDLLPKEDSKAREILAQEKAFKKIAQRGVIKLFNAVLLTQTSSAKTIANEKIAGVDRKEELINEISKEKFLDLVQSAGK